ncbi:flagellar hook-basal body complex protein FliE [Legionella spiritensis]|uniref:Flagellar hook-basal body complex protein FliE n=1 Tax=Legionella spiritensis TaxID=452 RepID=A0A0W0Z9I3_LEGSP|nr:flagellar hook-basal body complex protein FliE [Legionella spiritensis]KTD65778.1 flagellar hook-basal body complex protein [Legionella spiritensis]SNV41395.1 flagellar hook-basal body complex protein FliE [Legionella spiritensis]VEG90567.1 flagellar hook-basal body complex protein FliE [Legionella spiritensis]
MTDINVVSLLNQMKLMAAKAQGGGVETAVNRTQFGDVFQKALGGVSELQQSAEGLKVRFETGDPQVNLGEVMIAAKKSDLAFEATLRVRNKFVQAYQDIMNMPI